MKKCLFLIFVLCFELLVQFKSQSQSYPVLKHYDKNHLLNIALPLGGIGTGTVSLGGRGELRDWEIMNKPAVNYSGTTKGNDAPFFAVYVKTQKNKTTTKALMGPLYPSEYNHYEGRPVNQHGFPRFQEASFDAAYPFGTVNLSDPTMPIKVKIKGFNPLIPGDEENSGLPIAVLTYEITNTSAEPITVSVCGNMRNFIGQDGSKTRKDWKGDATYFGAKKNQNVFKEDQNVKGIYMYSDSISKNDPAYGTIVLATSENESVTYRKSSTDNSWAKATLDLWDDFSSDGELTDKVKLYDNDPLASLAVKKTIKANSKESFKFYIVWNFPNRFAWSKENIGNYYSTKYTNAWDAAQKIIPQIPQLEEKTKTFVNSFISSSLPQTVKEAALFNLSTLRSQTVFRIKSGHLMAWEGMFDEFGSCEGSCTHVWNYEQATPFLFGNLSKTMRDVEFNYSTDSIGLMSFRTRLPLGIAKPTGLAAADGQMGCIMKFYRDWKLSGDDKFLQKNWPQVKKALAFAWIKGGWDANQDGVMEGCQHNTMDVEYYGPNPQMQFWYLGALRAGEEMAKYLKDTEFQEKCSRLFTNGSAWTDQNIFNGQYYFQKIITPASRNEIAKGLTVGMGSNDISNPDYQLGEGCLVDQLVGQYMAHICGLGYLAKKENINTALQTVMKNNFISDFSPLFNNMRSYVLGNEAGLIMASWPKGRLKVPFPYFSEAMTGFEYTAAIGMLYENQTTNGLKCIDAIRSRFDGQKRNPFDEPECGRHYGRAMASWAAVLALSGFEYSGIEKSMRFSASEGNYFWSNGYSWGTVSIKKQGKQLKSTLEVLMGEVNLIKFSVNGYQPITYNATKSIKAGEQNEFILRL